METIVKETILYTLGRTHRLKCSSNSKKTAGVRLRLALYPTTKGDLGLWGEGKGVTYHHCDQANIKKLQPRFHHQALQSNKPSVLSLITEEGITVQSAAFRPS